MFTSGAQRRAAFASMEEAGTLARLKRGAGMVLLGGLLAGKFYVAKKLWNLHQAKVAAENQALGNRRSFGSLNHQQQVQTLYRQRQRTADYENIVRRGYGPRMQYRSSLRRWRFGG